jgi:hypothetical protein
VCRGKRPFTGFIAYRAKVQAKPWRTWSGEVRVVLVEFAEKLAWALKDERELTDPIKRLSQVHAEKKTKRTGEMKEG